MELIRQYLSLYSIEHKFRDIQHECILVCEKIKQGKEIEIDRALKEMKKILTSFRAEDHFQIILLHFYDRFQLKVKFGEGIESGVFYKREDSL